MLICHILFFFFFNDTATTEIYTLSLHDALPIRGSILLGYRIRARERAGVTGTAAVLAVARERTVPVLQSVLITAAVLAPLAILGSQAGLEFLHPMAVTLLGGLVSLLLVQ